MCACLPELQLGSNRQSKDKRNRETPPKLNYKGITLKEYFRISAQAKPTQTLKLIKEESRPSSHSSFAQTPVFNMQEKQRAVRGKFKTESCEVYNENQFRINTLRVGEQGNKVNAQSLEKGHKAIYIPFKKKDQRKIVFSKVGSNSIKEHVEMLNRSTLNSFYQLEENKKKMLKKMQQEKERANGMRLSDVFFITKYGSKFKIQVKAKQR